jgi:hypothetical protein
MSKSTIEDLEKKVEALEKRVGFLCIPAITTLLDEGPFGNLRGMGNQPLLMWIIAKLRDSDDTLCPEARNYLIGLLEKAADFGSHRPLRR